MKLYLLPAVVLVVAAVACWRVWPSPDGAGDTASMPLPPSLSRLHEDSQLTLEKLLSRKSRYSADDWDRLMERVMAADDKPFEEKERAFGELSQMARLRRAQWFFDDFARHKSIEECLAFCAALPFDSESQRAVTQKLVAKILDECDFATAVDHIRKMDMGVAYATARMVDRNLPESFRLADVLSLKQQLPADWQDAMLSSVPTHPHSALGYRDVRQLFGSSDETDKLLRAIGSLASTGKLTQSDVLDVMVNPLLADDAKKGVLQSAGQYSAPPDVAAFGNVLGAGLPPTLVESYVRAVADNVEKCRPGEGAEYGRAIPDLALRQFFFNRLAARWSITRGTTAGNPYLIELGPDERNGIEELSRMQSKQPR